MQKEATFKLIIINTYIIFLYNKKLILEFILIIY